MVYMTNVGHSYFFMAISLRLPTEDDTSNHGRNVWSLNDLGLFKNAVNMSNLL